MASSVEEAQKIQETAKQRGLILTIGFLTRFIPALQYVKKTETERFGGFASLRSKRTSNGQESKADSRMGVIRDLAIHDIDIARYLFNANPLAVRAEVGTMESEGIEDSVRMSLMFNREKNAYIESCWRLGPTHVRTLEVSGAKSTATLDYISQELFFGSPGISANPHFAFQLPLTLELQDFVSCVIQKRAPLVGGDDGVEALRVVEAAHESSRLGKPIDIS